MAPEGKESSRDAAPLIAASAWVALVDEEQYDRSWETATQYFKNAITRKEWNRTLKGFRKPLGKAEVRKQRSHAHKKALPGAPDGEYVVIQFDTTFENKASTVETVTVMHEKDGAWRVCGYFIR